MINEKYLANLDNKTVLECSRDVSGEFLNFITSVLSVRSSLGTLYRNNLEDVITHYNGFSILTDKQITTLINFLSNNGDIVYINSDKDLYTETFEAGTYFYVMWSLGECFVPFFGQSYGRYNSWRGYDR